MQHETNPCLGTLDEWPVIILRINNRRISYDSFVLGLSIYLYVVAFE